jgi:chemotaxis response regulator CheB
MLASTPLTVAIVDHHPVSRCAYCALLRSEGVEVVADVGPGDDAASTIVSLTPDVVIVDVSAGAQDVRALLDQMRQLRCAILLTSSAPRPNGRPELDGLAFLPKADICRSAIIELLD